MLLDMGLGNDVFGYGTKNTSNKTKNKEVALYQATKASSQLRKQSEEWKSHLDNGRKY